MAPIARIATTIYTIAIVPAHEIWFGVSRVGITIVWKREGFIAVDYHSPN
jgi:hypothetical protein